MSLDVGAEHRAAVAQAWALRKAAEIQTATQNHDNGWEDARLGPIRLEVATAERLGETL